MHPWRELIICVNALAVGGLAHSQPAFAGTRPCGVPSETTASSSNGVAAIEAINRGPIPVTVEETDRSGVRTYLALAPGERRLVAADGAHVWISRDVRRRCLSMFVAEDQQERWNIAGGIDHDYARMNVRSFPVYVAPEFMNHDNAILERCLAVLESSVKRLEGVVPRVAWTRISKVPIWLEYEPDKSSGGVYYASRDWLTASGISLAKAKSIQFTSSLAIMLAQDRNPLTHELAHAYHDQVLSFSYAPILSAFARAQQSGRYNAVRHLSGRWERAYAITNAVEFFAELSEAYFGVNDFFPFTREDLKKFDPASYRAISDAWERP